MNKLNMKMTEMMMTILFLANMLAVTFNAAPVQADPEYPYIIPSEWYAYFDTSDLSHGDWVHYANVFFHWETGWEYSYWCPDRNFDQVCAGPGAREGCDFEYDWTGDELDFTLVGKKGKSIMHFEEYYVPGVVRPPEEGEDPSEKPTLIVHVTLHLVEENDGTYIYMGKAKTPFYVIAWEPYGFIYTHDTFEYEVRLDTEMNVVWFTYVEHEFYIPPE